MTRAGGGFVITLVKTEARASMSKGQTRPSGAEGHGGAAALDILDALLTCQHLSSSAPDAGRVGRDFVVLN